MTFSQRRDALAAWILRLPAGETVAVVGHTGSGKTTLVNLDPAIVRSDVGGSEVGGVDVRRYDPEELRRQIGFIPQETFLFSATLGENIAWGVAGASARADSPGRGNRGPRPAISRVSQKDWIR